MRRQTTLHTPETALHKNWFMVDATDVPLGRLAADVAQILMGKHRPDYTPHVDCGDFVIITNGTKVGLSGNKAEIYKKQRYTYHAGGLKEESYGSLRTRRPEKLIEDAVKGMMPKNRLARHMMKKLKVYPAGEHPHQAQQPVAIQL